MVVGTIGFVALLGAYHRSTNWKNAEQTNGAMLGFSIAIINYGFTGFIIPG